MQLGDEAEAEASAANEAMGLLEKCCFLLKKGVDPLGATGNDSEAWARMLMKSSS